MDIDALRDLGALSDADYMARLDQLREHYRGLDTSSLPGKDAKVLAEELTRLIEIRPRDNLIGVFLQLLRVSLEKRPVSKAKLKVVFEATTEALQTVALEAREKFALLLAELAGCDALTLLSSMDFNELATKITKTVLEASSEPEIRFSSDLLNGLLSGSTSAALNLLLISLTKDFKSTPRAEIAKLALERAPASAIKRVNELMLVLFNDAKNSNSALRASRAEVAYQLFRINSDFVLELLGTLGGCIKAEERDRVITAAHVLCRMASCRHFAALHNHLLNELLLLFEHPDEEVRIVMVNHAAKLSRSAAAGQVLRYTTDRLRDKSEIVRRLAILQVERIVDIAELTFEVLQVLADRLRDKKVLVRRQAITSVTAIYAKKCLKAYVQRLPCDNSYKFLGNALVCSIGSISVFEDQMLVVSSLEASLTPLEYGAQASLEALLGLYCDLSEDGRVVLNKVLDVKAAWSKVLKDLLQEDDIDEITEIAAGNLREPFTTPTLKRSKIADPKPLRDLLEDINVKSALRTLIGNPVYEEQRSAMMILKEHPNWTDVLSALVCRSCNLMLCKDQVDILLSRLDSSSMSLLADFGTRFHELVRPLYASLLSAVAHAEAKAPLFNLIRELKSHVSLSEEQSGDLQLHIKEACQSGIYSEAKSAAFLAAAVMPERFIELAIVDPIVRGLRSEEDFIRLKSQLGVLKAVMQHKHICFESVKSPVLNYVSKDLMLKPTPNVSRAQQTEVSDVLHAKVEGVHLLASYGLKYGPETGELSVLNILKRLIGIGLRLQAYLTNLMASPDGFRISRLLSKAEAVLLRKAALGGYARLVCSKDHRELLRGKELTYLAFIACSDEQTYRDVLGKYLLNAIYVNHKLHPPLTVLLVLLSPFHKSYREALHFIFKSMLNLSTGEDSGKQLAIMPETYFHYLIYVLCKLPFNDSKFIRRSIATFVEAIAKQTKNYSSTYLIALCQQLRSFEIVDKKTVNCDLVLSYTVSTSPSMRDVIDSALDYLVTTFEATEQPPTLKFLVPTNLFKSMKALATPSPTAARALDFSVDVGSSRKRKRSPQSGSNKRLSMGPN